MSAEHALGLGAARFPSFAEFFEAVHGATPYDWQSRLADRLARGDAWPWEIAVPTGLGKTSCIAAAVYELARQLHLGGERTAPQRIIHVVERRTIVDSTAEYAQRIADAVNAVTDPRLEPVRAALARLLGTGDSVPIRVVGIHGESSDDLATWRSTGCVIMSMTAHQFVSRLLFRGFGMSPSTRPIAAGLCGVDRLVLFDEPHLVEPAVHAILDAERLQLKAGESLGLPAARTVLLGATVPSSIPMPEFYPADEQPRLTVDSAVEIEHPEARNRLDARRSARLRWSTGSDADTVKQLVAATRDAWEAGARRIVVFANTVALAQSVYRKLREGARGRSPAEERILLVTSRFRTADRPDRATGPLYRDPCTVVATQTLEVGVDISFDALVTEACGWNALVQRLGRLNRDGRSPDGIAEIVCGWQGERPVVRAGTGFVYGEEPVRRLTALLRDLDVAGEPLDLGWSGLAALTERDGVDPKQFDGPAPRIGTLHADMLPLVTLTRPVPDPDLRVEALVTGPDADQVAECRIAWRADLAVFDEFPRLRVDPAETVAVPRVALRAFLGADARNATRFADTGSGFGSGAPEPSIRGWGDHLTMGEIRIWDVSDEKWRRPTEPAEVELASELLLAPRAGGYDPELGWTGAAGSSAGIVQDVSLRVAAERMREGEGRSQLPDLVLSTATLDAARMPDDPLIEALERELREEIAAAEKGLADGQPFDDLAEGTLLPAAERFARALAGASAPAPTVAESGGSGLPGVDLSDPVSATPVAGGATAGVAVALLIRFPSLQRSGGSVELVTLGDHQRQVACYGASDAERSGLDRHLVRKIACACRLHDIGKCDAGMQEHSGWKPGEPLLAKSRPGRFTGPNGARAERRSRERCAISGGWRHEAFSQCLVRWSVLALVLHLIGAHHGWQRPILLPPAGRPRPGYPGPLDHADDFARLNRQYGPWGLAYLEAVVRLADWRASARPLSEIDPADPHLPAELRDRITRLEAGEMTADEAVAEDAARGAAVQSASESGSRAHGESGEERLIGLHTHPLTGWFTATGLLAAAVEAGDASARLRWEPLSPHTDAPIVPVLRGAVPTRELVERITGSAEWHRSQKLALEAGFVSGLGMKYQQMQPAERLRELLLEAEDEGLSLLLGLAGDLARSQPGKGDVRKIALPVPARHTNASYLKVALSRIDGSNPQSDEEAWTALHSTEAGYGIAKSDGGMDRSLHLRPGVNGMGDALNRQTRIALAPLAVFGMSRIGAGTPAGVGVRGRELVLPLPTTWVSFEALRAVSLLGRMPRGRAWARAGLGWVYVARAYYPTSKEVIWNGRAELRN